MAKLLHIFYHKEGTFSLLCQQVQYFTLSGGENSPMIEAEDDFYELFFANLEDH